MADDTKTPDWQAGSWEGSRRAQLRASLRRSVRQRMETLEAMVETSRHFAKLRAEGAFHHGEKSMHEPSTAGQAVAEPGTDHVQHLSQEGGEGRHRILLQGCTPTPLASYLKALGIHRLVAEQKDPGARGWWQDEHFVLESTLDVEGLNRFFLKEYRPTPVIAPWNGGSGFYQKDKKAGIDALRRSDADRFQVYRESIEIGSRILNTLDLTESPKEKEVKTDLVLRLRAELSDAALAWMDAALMLTSEEVRFPPLLGTGGNDGRLDFTNNFMQRLVDVFALSHDAPSTDEDLLAQSLFGETTPFLVSKKAIGQFSPGQAGGPNAGTGFESDSLINPLDFILMIEGALLFAAAATRRLGQEAPGVLAFPFTVRPRGSGQGGVGLPDETQARAEIWAPLWEKPASLDAVKTLFAEGRVTLGRRSAKDGLDFVRALGLLAADRGITSFQRYAFLMRSGKAYLATPLNRYHVPSQPQQDLISELDGWLWRLQDWARSDTAPNSIRTLAHRLENALFDLASAGGQRPPTVQKVLGLLGELQGRAGLSPAMQEKLPPLPLLSERWFQAARDETPEFHLAAALAGLQGVGDKHLPMRAHLAPVEPSPRREGWLSDGQRHQYCVWHHGALVKNLVGVLEKRLLLATKQGLDDKPLDGWPDTNLGTAVAFLGGATDDRRIARLLRGLAHCRAPRHIDWPQPTGAVPIPAAFALLKLVATPNAKLHRIGLLPEHQRVPLPGGMVRLLAAGRADEAVRLAWRHLRIAGLAVPDRPPCVAGLAGERLAAALLIPLTDPAVRQLHHALTGPTQRQAS